MPFTANRQFKANPRMIVEAPRAPTTPTATAARFLTASRACGAAGLGHGRPRSPRRWQAGAKLDYAPAFQFGHPLSFELANRMKELTPAGLDYVFFTGSGSEAADTALKMARAYWRTKGQGGKTRLIGREKGYHGVNFGGISVGGMVGNRKLFGQGVEADHLPHTQPPAGSSHKGMPAQGGRALADEPAEPDRAARRLNIAAVIVEPFSGSAGVVIPPVGYLQRLREICTAATTSC
jgi:beta-alanine--pyruvate transaminase